MKNISIWEDVESKYEYPSLDENINVDVLIIGGGITGISTLYNLRNSNKKVMLVEQNRIGRSVTCKSTGKLTYLQNNLIDKIRNTFNDKTAIKYIESQKHAIELAKKIIKEETISCDLEKVDSYLYTNNNKEIKKIKKLYNFLLKNKIEVLETNNDIVINKYMIKIKDSYIFHPLKFVYGLLKGNSNIYENTSIIKIEKKNNVFFCYTDKYVIKTKYVVVASHYPFFNIPFLFPIKGYLEKSYLSASKSNHKPLSLISYTNPFISIRTYKNYLIYLANSHSINKDVCDRKNFEELEKKLNDLNIKPDYLWSNIDIITNDGLPYIGRIKGNLLIGTGYNTWGLTNGILAGEILSDIILGKENEYMALFSPKRKNIKQLSGTFKDTYKNIEGYINGYLNKNNKSIKCPHLKCNLIYNEIEKTWDCPCHGSRFDEKGTCISGPSNSNIFD